MREGLINVQTNGFVWIVVPKTDGIGGIRAYASWAALHNDFPRSPEDPKLIVEEWYETSWAEPGDSVLFQAVQRDVRLARTS